MSSLHAATFICQRRIFSFLYISSLPIFLICHLKRKPVCLSLCLFVCMFICLHDLFRDFFLSLFYRQFVQGCRIMIFSVFLPLKGIPLTSMCITIKIHYIGKEQQLALSPRRRHCSFAIFLSEQSSLVQNWPSRHTNYEQYCSTHISVCPRSLVHFYRARRYKMEAFIL